MAKQYYIVSHEKKKKYGPYTDIDIKSMLEAQKINLNTKIWDIEEKKWTTASVVNDHIKNQGKEHGFVPVKMSVSKKKKTKNKEYDPFSWYLSDNGKEEGPFGEEKIKELIKSDKLSKKAFAFRGDKKAMLFVKDFEGDLKNTGFDKEATGVFKKVGRELSELKQDGAFSYKIWLDAFLKTLPIKVRVSNQQYARLVQIVQRTVKFIIIAAIIYGSVYVYFFPPRFILKIKNKFKNGQYLEYFADGKVKEEKNYKEGNLLGQQVKWYDNGQKQEECVFFENGEGECTGWSKKGNKIYHGWEKILKDPEHDGFRVVRNKKWVFWKNSAFDKVIYFDLGKKLRIERIEFNKMLENKLQDNVLHVEFSNDDKYIALASTHRLNLWKLKDNAIITEKLFLVKGQNLLFTKNNKYLMLQMNDKIKIFDTDKFLSKNEFDVENIKYSLLTKQQDYLIMTYLYNENLKDLKENQELTVFYDLKEDKKVYTLKHPITSSPIVVSQNSKYFAIPHVDKRRLYNIYKIIEFSNKQQLGKIQLDKESDNGHFAGGKFFWGQKGTKLVFFNIKTKRLRTLNVGRDSKILDFDASNGVVYVLANEKFRIFNLSSLRKIKELSFSTLPQKAWVSKKHFMSLLVQEGPNVLSMYRLPAGKELLTLIHKGRIFDSKFSSNGLNFASVSGEGSIEEMKMLNFNSLGNIKTITVQGDNLKTLQMSKGGRYLSLAGRESELFNGEKNNFQLVKKLYAFNKEVPIIDCVSHEIKCFVSSSKAALRFVVLDNGKVTLLEEKINEVKAIR